MSDVVKNATEEPNPAPNGETTTITHFQQLAAQLEAAMKAVLAEIPQFEMPQKAKTRKVGQHQTVPPDFIVNAAAAVKASEVDLIKVFDPAEAQAVLQFVEAFKPLVEVAAALAAGLDFTVKVQYARAAAGALTVYAIAQRLALNGDGTMERLVETMSRSLGRKRARPRVKAPAPPDTPSAPQV
jgi:hypothetical protein